MDLRYPKWYGMVWWEYNVLTTISVEKIQVDKDTASHFWGHFCSGHIVLLDDSTQLVTVRVCK